MAWPAATPRAGRRSAARQPSPSTVDRRPAPASPCARSCTSHSTGPSGAARRSRPGGRRRTVDDLQRLGRADRHGVGHRRDRQHVARAAVRRGHAQVQALALADRVARTRRRAARAPRRCAASTMSPGASPSRVAQEAPGVAVGDEADVVRVGLVGDREAALGRLGAHLRLGRVAEREDRPVELLAGQHGQHVRLVLGQVDAAPQQAVGAEPGVVAGDHRVEAQGHAPGPAPRRT